MIPQFIIAAPTSNAGKTTVTLGLLRALKNRGLTPQPFKCGPDYIDPKFHKIACDKIGVNLDLFMMSRDDIDKTYATYSNGASAICVEGVMGLFDGSKKQEGSTAELAKLLQLPIIFVVDAKSVAYSVAPLLYGFKNFDKELNIAGVIFNRVNTESHYQFLEEACTDVGIQPLGRLPFLPECEIPSKHLGLSIDKMEDYNNVVERVAKQMEATVDIDQLLKITTKKVKQKASLIPTDLSLGFKIAVAKDEGFNFSYVQNIEALKRMGEVVFFSPINDKQLPHADLVYLPGGYPEMYTKQITQNDLMLNSIKAYAENGGKIIAECGGMMYLGKFIIDQQGIKAKMAGIFNYSSSMAKMKLNLGYRTVKFNNYELKGHEFHYSNIIDIEQIETIGTVWNARGKEVETKIYRYKNVIASYMHFYFGEDELLRILYQELLAEVTKKEIQL